MTNMFYLGSVLGPTLYLLYTADLSITDGIEIGAFADDTAVLAIHADPVIASNKLQSSLDNIDSWSKKWQIKINEAKSVQVTFATRQCSCSTKLLNIMFMFNKNAKSTNKK